ncbi:hypothetical protein GMB51_11220 [Turicibacter sanguinis]|nr:hypothetical protein [Turicibacter sanguinis]MTN51518.1 hypothetical protein [Turicibacter sanguinis]MTN54716.1 hypothetical protein [Turicibacter sanguinis]MTN57799.1 hypothetical protein [Turicibacter sanguinis]MTN60914.1 hypothetical protein [Turicibacter sanguinis]
MKLLKPRRPETVKAEYHILKSTRLILDLYSNYSNHCEGEVLDHVMLELLKEDTDFVQWVSKQRTIKKFIQLGLVNELTEEQQKLFERQCSEVLTDESDEEACN